MASGPTYDINTLAGKVASVDNTPGLYIQMSGFVQGEADEGTTSPSPTNTCSIGVTCTPNFVLSSSLDGSSITSPDVTVNQDTAAATQNEPAIAVDPSNPSRVVAAANDYVTRTWTCFVSGTPCSELGDGYSGTYYSNDGGATWCCQSTDPSSIGTLIPGVEHLVDGSYDAGGDPALAFNSVGNVFFSGLGFDRTSPPNTVTVSKGTFSGSGTLTWGAPTFVNPTTSPSIFNDKEWVAADWHALSPFKDRVYVSWTLFVFNPITGVYLRSPIFFAYSTDGGSTFSAPMSIVGNVIFDQGSHIVVGSDGTVYVFWEGSRGLGSLSSIYTAKSTDGGATFSNPVAVAQLVDIAPPRYTLFRVNSFPMADISPDGTLYVTWSSEVKNTASSYATNPTCAYFYVGKPTVYASCHAAAYYSKSSDGGNTWSTPLLDFPTIDASSQEVSSGYPATNPDGTTLTAPTPGRVDTVFPSVATSPSGNIYLSAYESDVLSPWQTCATPASPTAVGRIDCLALGNHINNGRLDYAVTDLITATTNVVTTHPINSRYQFGGGFIGDYTGIAVGSDNVFHAVWTDTNNVQTVVWWYGFQFVPTPIHQQDIATAIGTF